MTSIIPKMVQEASDKKHDKQDKVGEENRPKRN